MENNEDQNLDLDNIDEFLGLPEPEYTQYAPSGQAFGITEMQVAKLNLSQDDILAVAVKSDSVDEKLVESLRANLQKVFPQNKVLIFGIGPQDSIHFSKISQNKEISSCNTGTFCADCNCGKKEQYEGKENV